MARTPEQHAREIIRDARHALRPELDLSGMDLQLLPPEVGALQHLEYLQLGDNQLAKLPWEIGHLHLLTQLDLRGNRLTHLPPLQDLGDLADLDLGRNAFESLPLTVCTLKRLALLRIDGNRIASLPPSIGKLRNLRLLNATDNLLDVLPREIAELGQLSKLVLDNNPLQEPLPALVADIPALYSYLRSLDDGQPQYEAKLLLVGEGEVGKSCLIAALKGLDFVEGRASTHGIELTPLTLDHPTNSVAMLLNAWDFGGQEVYRITHQFFFTRRAIYLVVWKPRQGQDENAIEDWCRRISLRVGTDAKILVVATHATQRMAELDYPLLRSQFGAVLVGSHEVDNASGDGIAALRAEIARHTARLPHMGEVVSASWQAARAELLALDEAQITYEHFSHICGRHGLDGQAARALARMLHNLGLVIHYDEDDGLRDVVVLQPEWLTKAISYVLEDAPTRAAKGVLGHHRLHDIWRADELGGYSTTDHPFFLRLMEKFDVSYRIPDTHKSLVGQLVPYERPEIPWVVNARMRTLSLRCLLDEPVDGLIGWLTVRHHRFSVGVHWRRGVFVQHAQWDSQALLEMIDDRQLALTVTGPSPDAFFSVLRDGIEYLIRQRWEGLSYELLVPCQGTLDDGAKCPDTFKFRHLVRDREDGELSVRCPECRTTFDVNQLLTGFAPVRTSLQGELLAIHERLNVVSSDLADVKAVTAESAKQIRMVLRAVNEEVPDCPRLFTLVPVERKGVDNLRFWGTKCRLTLWCEHADAEHPWPDASYELSQTKEWATDLAPYAALVLQTLRLVVPVGASALGVMMSEAQLKTVNRELDLMKAVVERIPMPGAAPASPFSTGGGQLTKAEGGGLRALRTLLAGKDPIRAYGRLRRRQTPTGDFVWICPAHIHEYDPGLPVLPQPGAA